MKSKRAKTIPKREAWLYKNSQALKLVRTGLAQARRGEFVEGPNLKADKLLVSKLAD